MKVTAGMVFIYTLLRLHVENLANKEGGLEAENTPTQHQADKHVSLRVFNPVRYHTHLQLCILLPGHAIPAVFNTSTSERSVAKGCLCPLMVAAGQCTLPEEEARP